ncbi:MAG: phenylalanine--tRNA ligase subunit beta, partial [Candidatus Aminicenantales bacterium]
ETLFQHGMDEVVNLSFMDPERAEVLSGDLIPVPIRNPISSKAALMRTTLIGGLLENILWNRNRGADGVHIFEIGKIFFAKEDAFREQLMLGVAMTGRVGDVHWRDRGRSADFFKLKGACEAVMRRLRYEPLAYQEASHPRFREGVVLSLHFKGERIGVLGLLKQELLKAFDLDEDVWAAELNLDLLFAKQAKAFEVEPVPKYPSVIRDVSFIADRSVPYQDIREAVERLRLPHLERFYLYDRFSGASIPRDKVSLSFRFVFRHQGRTLQAAEVDRMQEKIVSALRTRFQFHLREGGEIDK